MTTFAKTTAAVLALALALPMVAHAQTAAPATTVAKAKKTMTYDCTKAGNKNKAACKTAAPVAAATAATPAAPVVKKPMFGGMMAPKPATPAAPAVAAPAVKKPMFGGMMTPKPAAAKPAAKADSNNPNLVAYTTKSGKVIHYDCSKAGNKNKTACKGR